MKDNFKVILGSNIKEVKKADKLDLYKNAFVNALVKATETDEQDRDRLKQVVYYGVKYMGQKDRRGMAFTREQVESEFSLICCLKDMMARLTLNEFINVFPIPKEYDGEKCQSKDYFYAIKEFSKYNLNEPIGENLENILWDTMNSDIFIFSAYIWSVLGCLRSHYGEPGIMEEFMEEQGIETHTMYESNGFKYIQSSKTGKTFPVKEAKKRVPKYLKVVGV